MEKTISKHEKPIPEIAALIQKAYGLMTSNPDKCDRIAHEAMQQYPKHKYIPGMSHGYMHTYLEYYLQGEFAPAMENNKKAEAFFLSINNTHCLQSAYKDIGVGYNDWKTPEQALQDCNINPDLQQEGDNPKLECAILVNTITDITSISHIMENN